MKEQKERRRRLLGKKSVRYHKDEEDKKRKDLENLRGEQKYKYLKEQVSLLKL